ncbi:anaphase-promoting complex subunit 13 isoform X2 [Polyodon spathula]|uniref:anaphase-promoting complex subunit 13 isoform X2 n=1 Tax=Polyodon spathula TaxID=7913 RepID=UPI001B7E67EF|nr:anaphase-promoting complex subunit 13 isoform X2 [Polyodon spathula]
MKFDRFTVEERREIISIYSTMRGSARAVGVMFHLKYPHRPRPCTATVYNVIKRFRETGSVHHGPRRQGRSLISDSATASSLVTNVALNPQKSTRSLARECGISTTSVTRVLQRCNFHQYKVRIVPDLQAGAEAIQAAPAAWTWVSSHGGQRRTPGESGLSASEGRCAGMDSEGQGDGRILDPVGDALKEDRLPFKDVTIPLVKSKRIQQDFKYRAGR